MTLRRIEGYGKRRKPGDRCLHRGGHRATVRDVVAQVGMRVDAGGDGLDARLDQPEHGQRHTVGRRPIGGQRPNPTSDFGRPNTQRAVHRLDMSGGRPVALGGKDGDLADGLQRAGQRQQSRCGNPIVIRDKDVHGPRL
jgi:hypothetical protein